MKVSSFAVFGVVFIVILFVVLTLMHLHSLADNRESSTPVLQVQSPIHVCFASDDTDLRIPAVAIRSLLANARQPQRFLFHFITTSQLSSTFQELFRAYLQGISVKVYHNDDFLRRIQSEILYTGPSSEMSARAATAFPLVRFFLHEFLDLDTKQLIFLDTDSVVLGDLGQLPGLALRGRPVAAVRSCQHKVGSLIDLDLLRQFGGFHGRGKGPNKQDCFASTSLLVIDVQTWKHQNVSGRVLEALRLQRHVAEKLHEDLWIGGMSVPPMLLALENGFHTLGPEWLCDHLGREELSLEDAHDLTELSISHEDLRNLGVTVTDQGMSPPLHSCSATCKVLHFGGPSKPWDLLEEHAKPPLCILPQKVSAFESISQRSSTDKHISDKLLKCKDHPVLPCSSLWYAYLEESDCGLKDFQKEWQEERMRQEGGGLNT